MKNFKSNLLLSLLTSFLATSCLVGKTEESQNLEDGAASACISSVSTSAGVVAIKNPGATTAPYGHLEYKPSGYASSGANYPVIIFLHGLGEQGSDSNGTLQSKMAAHGPFKRIGQNRHFPALVFAPQSPAWWNSTTLRNFLNYIIANYRVDKSRIYLTGLSMGGGGTWDYMRFDSARLAAAIPIAGATSANNSAAERAALLAVPHISVHNVDDGTVGYGNSNGFGNSVGAALGATNMVLSGYVNGSNVTSHYDENARRWILASGSLVFKDSAGEFYTPPYIYAFDASGGHDSWTKTYAKEETWEWLFCQRKVSALNL